MTLKRRRVRDILDDNEIFFSTIAFTILTIMSLIVSVVAVFIASRQADIANKQTALISIQTSLLIRQNQPIIHLALSHAPFLHDSLTVSNIGAPIDNFNDQPITFIEINVSKYPANNNNSFSTTRDYFTPVDSYYNQFFPTGNATGLLDRWIGVGFKGGNEARLGFLIDTANAFFKKKGQFLTIGIWRYIRADYSDLFGENHSDLYYIDEFGSCKVPSKESQSIRGEYYENNVPKTQISKPPSVDMLMSSDQFNEELSKIMKTLPEKDQSIVGMPCNSIGR